MSAAWEPLREAALMLVSHESIKQRLISAFSIHLQDMDADVLPDAVRPGFRYLTGRMTGIAPMRGETAVAATVRKMSNEDAAACARQIVELLFECERQRAPVARGLPRPVVALYSAEAAEA